MKGLDRRLTILLAEDNQADIFLVSEALADQGLDVELTVHRDGEELFQLIERIDAGERPCPDLVLLDLNLPKRNGLQLLLRLRESPVCAPVPVIIVTSSDAPKDREAAARLGADSYFRKPSDYDEFLRLGAVVKELMAG